MTTSGTTSFNLSIDEIVEESYERIGIRSNSGYDIKSARRSLNILFSEWSNRGVHLWKVELNEIAMVAGQAAYTVPSNVSDVLEAYISSSSGTPGTTTNDLTLNKIDRSAYAALPNKGTTGQPSQYYVDRQVTPEIYLYQTPDLSTYTYLKYYSINRIEDAGAYTNNADVVYRFIPGMCAGLAYYLSQKRSPERVDMLKMAYEDEMKRALDEDGSRTSLYIAPQSYFPQGI
jgi:hypothetical protein